MKHLFITLFTLIVASSTVCAHQLTVNLGTPFRGKVTLVGHQGFQNKTLTKQNLNGIQSFMLVIPDDYQGVANLDFQGYGSLFLILNQEDITIEIGQLSNLNQPVFTQSNENNWLNTFVLEQSERVAKRNGLSYLMPMYQNGNNDSLFNLMQAEYNSLDREEAAFFEQLPDDSYVKFYIPLRQFVEDQMNAVRNKEENTAHLIAEFYQFNIQDDRLWNSALLEPFLEGQVAVVEMQGAQAEVEAQCERMVDHIYNGLKGEPFKLLDVADFLLTVFEKRGLEQTAEYLSLKLLNQNQPPVEGDLRNKMEQYRTMANGETAADIAFESPVKGKSKLSDLDGYKLLFFWKSGCAGCKEAIPDLIALKGELQEKGITLIGFSLDTEKSKFDRYAQQLPWANRSDLKGWESPTVKKYHLFGTPAFYLLDANNKILLKPKSMAQLELYIKNGLPND